MKESLNNFKYHYMKTKRIIWLHIVISAFFLFYLFIFFLIPIPLGLFHYDIPYISSL